MKKDGYSRPGFFGTINHYDASGKKIGESRPGFFGGMNNYDANGHKVGHSSPGFFGGMNHYDNNGHKPDTAVPVCLEVLIHTTIMVIKNATAKKVSWADIIIMRSNGDDNYDFDKS